MRPSIRDYLALRRAAVTIITPGWAHGNDLSHCGTRPIPAMAQRDSPALSPAASLRRRDHGLRQFDFQRNAHIGDLLRGHFDPQLSFILLDRKSGAARK